MLTEQLQAIKQTEQLCRELLGRAQAQRLRILAEAEQEAETEYSKQEASARREGEARLAQAREEAAALKQEQLCQREAELSRLRDGNEARIAHAVTKIMERMCSGDDCADEPFQPFGAQTG